MATWNRAFLLGGGFRGAVYLGQWKMIGRELGQRVREKSRPARPNFFVPVEKFLKIPYRLAIQRTDRGGTMDEHPMIKTTRAFLKAIEAVETDKCINLNLGYHDKKISETFNALITEAHYMPLLSAVIINNKGE